jgi:peptidoglycan/xylan/chitin deacetylase (PgdA/CDA1 family)
MYHDIVPAGAEDTSGFRGVDAALYKVTPDLFAAHLRAITRRVTPPAAAASASPALPAPVLTFDDGGVSALVAADLLEQHGLAGHFFITVDYIGSAGFLTAADIRALGRRGHRIGSHSCSHPLRMGHGSRQHVLEEWTRSRAVLSDLLSADVTVASVPGGDFGPIVAEAAAAAGFIRLFTSEPARSSHEMYGLTVHGRFTIHRWTSPETAGAAAAGTWLPWAGQIVAWNAKKIGKRLAGARYLQLRRLILGHGNEVRWGDRIRN